MLKKLILILFVSTGSAFAAMSCTQTDMTPPGRWHCTASDGGAADALYFRDFMAGGNDPHTVQAYSCGAIIEVEPSTVSVRFDTTLSYTFFLYPQSGCSGPSQKTKFIACTAADAGSCVATMAAITNTLGFAVSNGHAPYIGPDPTIDLTKMVVLKAPRRYSAGFGIVLSTFGAANNYEFDGFLFTADYRWGSIDNHDFGNQPLVKIGNDGATSFADKPRDIAFEKCMMVPEEEIVYGQSAGSHIQLNHFRTVSTMLGPDADGFSLTNSWLAGSGSFQPSQNNIHVAPTSCSSAGLGTQCTGTGLSAALGLTAMSCPTGASVACLNGGGATRVAFGGATGNWTPLNGLASVYYVDANTIGIDSGSVLNKYIPAHLNSSGFGAFTGTLDGRLALQVFDGSYTMPVGAMSRANIEGNYIQGIWASFVGGGSWRTSYGIVLAGSDASHIILGSIVGSPPVVGQNISVPVPYSTASPSVWCQQSAPNACFYAANKERVGKVTAVSGTTTVTATVVPYGPDGIDIAPGTGTSCAQYFDTSLVTATGNPCMAQWDGYQSVQDASWISNTFEYREEDTTYGKGCLELKTSKNFLLDGNFFRGLPCEFFQDTVIQSVGGAGYNSGTTATWGSSINSKFTHNIAGSPNPSLGADVRFGVNGDYGEATATRGTDTYLAQNVFIQQMTVSGAAYELTTWNGTNGGYVHNTSTISPNNLGYWSWLLFAGSCIPGRFYHDDYGIMPSGYSYKDNITPFGIGPTGPTVAGWDAPGCWVGSASAIHHNLFTTDSGPALSGVITDPAVVNGWFPTSTAALPGSVWTAGTCTFADISKCGLPAGSAYRGTASDGADPGADLLEVYDHIHRWSKRAGLITLCVTCAGGPNSQWPLSSNWTINTTTASPTFTIVNSSAACTAHLYTDLAYINEHADTTGAGNANCTRSGNTVASQNVTFVFGHHSALTAGTSYRYKICDGGCTSSDTVMVGTFTTAGASAPSITSTSPLPSATQGSPYSFQFAASGSTPITWTGTSIPAGLTLSSSGLLSGTPSGSGTSTLHITATNANGSNGPTDFSLTISAVACTFSLSPTSHNFAAGGGTQSITVTASNSGCAWVAGLVPPWIGFIPSSGTGSGSTTATIGANVGPSRSASPVIGTAGHPGGGTDAPAFSVTQDSGCSFILSPTSVAFAAAGGTMTIFATASDPACPWTASTGTGWLSFTSASGTGSSSTGVIADTNAGGASRSGSATIGGQTLSVTQFAGIGTSITGGKMTGGTIK